MVGAAPLSTTVLWFCENASWPPEGEAVDPSGPHLLSSMLPEDSRIAGRQEGETVLEGSVGCCLI